MDINESPVFVLLNLSINPAQKDLPVTIVIIPLSLNSLKTCYEIDLAYFKF